MSIVDSCAGGKIMRAKIVDENLIIHTVPLAKVHVGQNDVRVEFDDIYEKRHTAVLHRFKLCE